MRYITAKDIRLKKRNPLSHKGQNGRVLVIGGSEDYVGAVALAGISALRTGADWVTIAAPEKVGWAVSCLFPDLVVKKFRCRHFEKRHVKELLAIEEQFDVVLIGNGIGIASKEFVVDFIKRSKMRMVIDADAIKVMRLQDINNAIITPHHQEFRMLMSNSALDENSFAAHLRDNAIVLKGNVDIIYSKHKTAYNKTGNAGMTKGGTGDVLAGIAAGFYAQGYTAFDAACYAAYFNGLIGDILLKKHKGYTYLASDMVDTIQHAMKRCRSSHQGSFQKWLK